MRIEILDITAREIRVGDTLVDKPTPLLVEHIVVKNLPSRDSNGFVIVNAARWINLHEYVKVKRLNQTD